MPPWVSANDNKGAAACGLWPGRMGVPGMKARIELNIHDTWIGVCWMPGHTYICLLPFITIHLWRDGA